MICFILLIIDYVCAAFGVKFAQDTVSLVIASFLEMLAEGGILFITSVINMSKKDVE